MRTTLSPLAAGAEASGLPVSGAALEGGVLEQPARAVRAREQESANARNFFIVAGSSLSVLSDETNCLHIENDCPQPLLYYSNVSEKMQAAFRIMIKYFWGDADLSAFFSKNSRRSKTILHAATKQRKMCLIHGQMSTNQRCTRRQVLSEKQRTPGRIHLPGVRMSRFIILCVRRRRSGSRPTGGGRISA